MRLDTLDPRIKLLIMAEMSTASLITRRPIGVLAIMSLSLLILLTGGVKLSALWLKARTIFGLIASLFAIQCLFARAGEPLIYVADVTIITREGLETASIVGLRLLVIVLCSLIVLRGQPRDYLLALKSFGIPYEIVFMVMAAMRFLPMLRDEAQDVLCALQMRGMRIKKTGPFHKAGVYVNIIFPVTAGALRRAEQLSIAMEARGFRAFPGRTYMRTLRSRVSDWIYLTAITVALLAVVFFS